MGPVHWDDTPFVGGFRDLGALAGSVEVRAAHLRLPAGTQAAPADDGGGEMLTFVLDGGGTVGGREFGPGDTILGIGDGLVAGPLGLEVLTFEDQSGRGGAARGPAVAVLADVVPDVVRQHRTDVAYRNVARAAGSVRSGMQHITVAPGAESMPPHIHSAEEELYVVLAGGGDALLGDERSPVRRGSVLARPAGNGVPNMFVAGDEGLVVLAWGQRDGRDLIWYPRSRKLWHRGLGLIHRIDEPYLDYWDGEPA